MNYARLNPSKQAVCSICLDLEFSTKLFEERLEPSVTLGGAQWRAEHRGRGENPQIRQRVAEHFKAGLFKFGFCFRVAFTQVSAVDKAVANQVFFHFGFEGFAFFKDFHEFLSSYGIDPGTDYRY